MRARVFYLSPTPFPQYTILYIIFLDLRIERYCGNGGPATTAGFRGVPSRGAGRVYQPGSLWAVRTWMG